MEKNRKEKQMLFEWGLNSYSKDFFVRTDPRRESYFFKRSDDLYIREYKFDDLPDFMEELDVLWADDEVMESIKKVIGVAAMKNRPVKLDERSEQEKNQLDQDEKLPIYIYNF